MSSGQYASAAFRPAKRRAGSSQGEENIAMNTGRAKACTSCRQVKLKCDSAETFPASCSRCTSKGLDCRMDSNFKRTPTRYKLEKVTSELSTLKEVIKSQSAPGNVNTIYRQGRASQTSLSPDSLLGSGKAPTAGASPFDPQISSFFGIEQFEASAFEIGKQCLGDVQVDGVAIVQLFEHFKHQYWHHGIVLDTSPTLAELRKQSSILFWSIVLTSSRYHPLYSYIYPSLIQPYEQLLSSYLVRAIHSLNTIHAIMILVTWPLPVKRQPEDPTWNYCGLIINAAICIGLHRPGREKEFGFSRAIQKDVELRSKTWLQIFHRSITYSSRLGVPPPLADEATLRDVAVMASDFGLSENDATQLEIVRQFAKAGQALQNQTDSNIRDSLVLMACGELDTLRAKSRGKWIAETELQASGAKLFLYGWSFQGRSQDPTGEFLRLNDASEPTISRKLLLYEALGSATHYVHIFSELGSSNLTKQSPSPSKNIPPSIYLPKYHFYTLYYAALTLYYFLANFPQASMSDQELARNHIRLAHTVLSRCAFEEPESEWFRLASNIELVGQFSGRRLPAEAQITSRLGACLFYDGMLKIAIMRAERGVRSYPSDLTQGPPEPERSKQEENTSHSQQEMSHGAGYAAESSADQQPIPQQWEDAFWGWDAPMLDSVDLQLDWNGPETWQP